MGAHSTLHRSATTIIFVSRARQKWQMMTEHLSQSAAEFRSYLSLRVATLLLLLLLEINIFRNMRPWATIALPLFIIPVCSVWWRQWTRTAHCQREKWEGKFSFAARNGKVWIVPKIPSIHAKFQFVVNTILENYLIIVFHSINKHNLIVSIWNCVPILGCED